LAKPLTTLGSVCFVAWLDFSDVVLLFFGTDIFLEIPTADEKCKKVLMLLSGAG
jgi:hypothetical protein